AGLVSFSCVESQRKSKALAPGVPKEEDWQSWILEEKVRSASLRIIADHARAATFLISDGVLPMNEGRGYVLRKIIRRAIRHGRLLGQEKPFLFEMVFAVRDLMKDAYPELSETTTRVAETVRGEETRFAHVMDIGLKRLDDDLAPLSAEKARNAQTAVRESGEQPFKLYFTVWRPRHFIQHA